MREGMVPPSSASVLWEIQQGFGAAMVTVWVAARGCARARTVASSRCASAQRFSSPCLARFPRVLRRGPRVMQHLTHLYAGTWRVAYTESMAARRRASVTPGLSLMSLSVALTLVLVLSNTWLAAAEDGGTQTRVCITCLDSREPCADIRSWRLDLFLCA